MTTATAVDAPVYGPVQKLWTDGTAVILGGGPSLTAADAEYCRERAPVIAIKEAAVCSLPGVTPPAPWADVLYACDPKWWRWEQGAKGFRGHRYALAPQDPKLPNVHVLRNSGAEGLELDPSAIRTGNNSGYQAINLAVHLGATRIVLLGFDMWRAADGRNNWFGKHPNHIDSPYPLFLQRFDTIVEPLKAAGITVINSSRFTLLRAFPQVPLEEALP